MGLLPACPSYRENEKRTWDLPRTAVTLSQLSHGLVTLLHCDADHCRYAPLDILIGRGPTGHADPHSRMPLPLRSSTPAGPIALDIPDDPPRERDKVLSCKTRKVKHRAATALRMGANSLCRAKGLLRRVLSPHADQARHCPGDYGHRP